MMKKTFYFFLVISVFLSCISCTTTVSSEDRRHTKEAMVAVRAHYFFRTVQDCVKKDLRLLENKLSDYAYGE